MPLPHRGIAFTVYCTGTTTSVRSTVMIWHTAIDPQRQAPCGEPVLPCHERSAGAGNSRDYQGIRRE